MSTPKQLKCKDLVAQVQDRSKDEKACDLRSIIVAPHDSDMVERVVCCVRKVAFCPENYVLSKLPGTELAYPCAECHIVDAHVAYLGDATYPRKFTMVGMQRPDLVEQHLERLCGNDKRFHMQMVLRNHAYYDGYNRDDRIATMYLRLWVRVWIIPVGEMEGTRLPFLPDNVNKATNTAPGGPNDS